MPIVATVLTRITATPPMTAGLVRVAAAGLAGTVNAFFAVGGIAGSWAAGTFCIGDVALNYNRIRRSITF
jgi:hypothetical protein